MAQFDLIDKAIKENAECGDGQDVMMLVQAELLLYEQFSGMEDPPQDWPEGESDDDPDQETPDEQRKREEAGGYFSR